MLPNDGKSISRIVASFFIEYQIYKDNKERKVNILHRITESNKENKRK